MPKRKSAFVYRLEYWGFRAVVGFIRALPLETASWLSGKSWRLICPFIRRHKRAMDAIGKAFPDQDEVWKRARILEMWENLGRVFAEGFHLDRIVAEGRITIDDEEAVRTAIGPRGQFVASGVHLGNWETGAAIVPDMGGTACGIYQRIHNPLVEAYVRTMRAPLYLGGLFAKQNEAGRKVMRAVQKGASLVTMGDLRDHGGPEIAFFGLPAPTNIFPALIARRYGLPLFAAMVARVPAEGRQVRFQIRMVPVAVPNSSNALGDAEAATIALQRQFEEFIREYPGQWMWVHRRWG